MSRTKKLLILVIFTWFLILDKIKDGDYVLRDVTHKLYLVLLRTAKGFPLKAKSLRNTATYQKLGEGFYQPPMYQGGDMTCLSVYVWGLITKWLWRS